MTQYSPGPYMKMSPTGLPGLLVVLFVVFTTCAFFGVQFLWVLLGLGALGLGLAVVLCLVHERVLKPALSLKPDRGSAKHKAI